MWREFITCKTEKHSEEHGYIADKQHRGREGRTLIDIVALKQFTTEMHHYQRSNMGMVECDAKACYNRITPELLVSLYEKAGCPPQVVDFLYSPLTQLEYHMVTALVISEQSDISTVNNLLFGIGQGATDGPPG
eukprot:2307612-Ditylum_brightwellii.AAC.1